MQNSIKVKDKGVFFQKKCDFFKSVFCSIILAVEDGLLQLFHSEVFNNQRSLFFFLTNKNNTLPYEH